jgi:tRNA(Ile)-lysidine synthase
MRLLAEIEAFFSHRASVSPGDGVVVAFSGGPDSTALLWSLRELASPLGISLSALHVDHGFDPGSRGRAAAAAAIASRLGVRFNAVHIEAPRLLHAGEAVEEAGRRLRYAALEAERRRLGARYVATGHHRDDQAETVALRLLLGSGLEGLAGILPVRGMVVRPLLTLSRREILLGLRALEARERAPGPLIEPVRDPTNRDPAHLRNRLRLGALPHLETAEAGFSERLARLADKAERARIRVEAWLDDRLAPRRLASGGIAIEAKLLRDLPASVLASALALLHRRAGAPHPASGAARAELLRHLAHVSTHAKGALTAGCDCGDGWRWEVRGSEFSLIPPASPDRGRAAGFTYTLPVPGEIEIPEISARVKISPGIVEPWMLRGESRRVGLALPATVGDWLTVRSRLPGDRLQPLGAPGRRRLKEVLIDRRVPREERDRIPLICWRERIAWVPGVTIEQAFRLEDGATAWIAEITSS